MLQVFIKGNDLRRWMLRQLQGNWQFREWGPVRVPKKLFWTSSSRKIPGWPRFLGVKTWAWQRSCDQEKSRSVNTLASAVSQTYWVAGAFTGNSHLIGHVWNSSCVLCSWSRSWRYKMNIFTNFVKKILDHFLNCFGYICKYVLLWNDTKHNLEMSEKDN